MSDSIGADEYGVTDGYHDIAGVWRPTSEAARASLRAAIGDPLPAAPMWFVPVGSSARLDSSCLLRLDDGRELGPIVQIPADTPIGYHDLQPTDGGPATRLVIHPEWCPAAPEGWGVAAQLYALNSSASQGIGDFGDLARLAKWVEREGGASVLLSPLHAPSPAGTQQDSPYYPSSRRWRNPLHLRVAGLPARRTALIDRDAVWADKREALWALYCEGGRPADSPWRAWAVEQGESLWQWAQWCADAEGSWTEAEREFHAWLQWCIDRQLHSVREAAPNVSIIGDLAIGFDPLGADAAAFANVLAHGCRIGAPPDAFNPAGQDWGLPPFSPWKLRAAHYAPFIETVRGALRGVQGIRLDHVMGLFRQYWMPPGQGPAAGAYVRFPAEELLAILAIEATRAGAFVIGEDLGTVEPHVRDVLRRFGILGTIVMWFEDAEPEGYPEQALATVTTHDLPTIAGVWRELDGDAVIRRRLLALCGEASLSVGDAVVRVHQRLAAAPSIMKLVTLDDLCLAELRPNVPGTTIERPNWRLPLPLSLEELEESPVAAGVAAAFRSKG